MTKRAIFLLLLFLNFTLSYAQEKLYQFNVGDFQEITVVDHLNVTYRNVPDSPGVVEFRVDPRYVSDLSFENKKGKLKIQNDGEQPDSIFSPIVVYSSSLTSATNWGDGKLQVQAPPEVAKFKAKVIGNGSVVVTDVQATELTAAVQAGKGRIFVSGKAHTASLQLMSAGSIEAGSLEAAVVRCRMYGTGSIDCCPQEDLSVAGITSGTVYYKGSPAKIVNRSIGAHLVKIENGNM